MPYDSLSADLSVSVRSVCLNVNAPWTDYHIQVH